MRFAFAPSSHRADVRVRLAAACALLLAAVLLLAAPAWADESESSAPSSNHVYVNQLSDSSFLYQTSIADLTQADSYYEGQTVFVQGEVVGDCIKDEIQQQNCWVTLQDADSANPGVVALLMTSEQAKNIDTYGRYGVTGTILQVRGTFHLECKDHQGMSDIHVEEVSALSAGVEQAPSASPGMLGLGIVAVLAGLALLALYRSKREGAL